MLPPQLDPNQLKTESSIAPPMFTSFNSNVSIHDCKYEDNAEGHLSEKCHSPIHKVGRAGLAVSAQHSQDASLAHAIITMVDMNAQEVVITKQESTGRIHSSEREVLLSDPPSSPVSLISIQSRTKSSQNKM